MPFSSERTAVLGLGDFFLVGPWGLKSISVVWAVLYDLLCSQLENYRVGPSPWLSLRGNNVSKWMNSGGK